MRDRRSAGVLAVAATLAALVAAAPGRADEAMPSTVITSGSFRIEFGGFYQRGYANVDKYVEQWMTANNIHAAQLAFRRNGKLLFSHAYTRGASWPLVKTTNVMRLASVSKMMATTAVTILENRRRGPRLNPSTKVFPYLGITGPLLPSQPVSPYINTITVQNLVDHTAGLHGEGPGDPLFRMRDVEVVIKHEPLTKTQFAKYIYGYPLLFKPGTKSVYSNVGYLLLGMVVEKFTGKSFLSFMQTSLKPLGINNLSLGRTKYALRSANEVKPDDPYTGPSIFDLSAHPAIKPFNYEGGDIVWENADSPSDFLTNAESISLLIHTYNAYGTGGRAAGAARDGCMPGASTWAQSLFNNVDYALFFNSGPCLDFTSTVIKDLNNFIGLI